MNIRVHRNSKSAITWRGIFAAAAAIRKSCRPSKMRAVRREDDSRATYEENMDLTEIGKAYRRLDYQTKVTGRAQYLADMNVPGMCHGKILRSPYAHARIRKVDASKALKVPGVVAVLTRDDILHDEGIEPYYGPVFKDQTIVAVDKVRHVGDPVAAVAAFSVDAAET